MTDEDTYVSMSAPFLLVSTLSLSIKDFVFMTRVETYKLRGAVSTEWSTVE